VLFLPATLLALWLPEHPDRELDTITIGLEGSHIVDWASAPVRRASGVPCGGQCPCPEGTVVTISAARARRIAIRRDDGYAILARVGAKTSGPLQPLVLALVAFAAMDRTPALSMTTAAPVLSPLLFVGRR
jgi:hypothetical protein